MSGNVTRQREALASRVGFILEPVTSSVPVLAIAFVVSGMTATPLAAGSEKPLFKSLVFHQVEAGVVEANDSRFILAKTAIASSTPRRSRKLLAGPA